MIGAEDFGLYALELTIINIVSLTVVFGMDVGTIKFYLTIWWKASNPRGDKL